MKEYYPSKILERACITWVWTDEWCPNCGKKNIRAGILDSRPIKFACLSCTYVGIPSLPCPNLDAERIDANG